MYYVLSLAGLALGIDFYNVGVGRRTTFPFSNTPKLYCCFSRESESYPLRAGDSHALLLAAIAPATPATPLTDHLKRPGASPETVRIDGDGTALLESGRLHTVSPILPRCNGFPRHSTTDYPVSREYNEMVRLTPPVANRGKLNPAVPT